MFLMMAIHLRRRAVRLMVAGILLWLLTISCRGGTGVVARSPDAGASGVSGLATIRVQFARAMDMTATPELALTPAVRGMARWEDERTLVLRPASPLVAETTYTVRLSGTARQAGGAETAEVSETWQFTTRALRVLFMGWDAEEQAQLFVADGDGGAATQVTDAPLGILDYALAPDGSGVVYGAPRDGGGSDLWQIALDGGAPDGEARRLVSCDGDLCSGASWLPDGERLVYERRTFEEGNGEPGPPRLWWLAPQSGETTPLFSDETLLGHSVRFSGDGRWMSTVVPLERALQIYDFETGDVLRLDYEMGEPGAWHPWRPELLFNNITAQGESFSVHLFRLALPAGETTNLSGDVVTNDGAPSWSPDGERIAFGRKVPRASVGRQLWVMDADGRGAVALTSDLDSNFGPPSWSPDGRQLLAQRFDIRQTGGDPSVWLVDVNDGALHQVAEAGFGPSWLP